jgi:multiple sugar transport system substrate-binding protein
MLVHKNVLRMMTVMIFLGMMTAGCTKKADAPGQAAEHGISLTFWHTYNDAETAVLETVVLPRWKERYPEITINSVRQDSGQFHQMIVTSFGTGQSPDIARIDVVNTAAYAHQGGLAALDDFEGFTGLKARFLDGPLSTNLYRGRYFGLPLDTNCKAAVLNTRILAEMGLTGTEFTLEDFIEGAKKRSAWSISVSGVGDWDLYPWFWLFGGTLTDSGFTHTIGFLDSPASVAAVTALADLRRQKIFTIRDIDGSVDAWDGINSEYAMFLEGPWFFGAYAEREAAGIAVSTVPTWRGRGASVVGGENIAVFSTSKNKDAAWRFIQFMTGEDTQLAMLEAGQIPVLKSLVEHEKVTGSPVWSVYMKQLNLGASSRISSPYFTALGEIWSDAMTNIFSGGADIQTELSSAAALMEEQLERQQ